MAGRKEEEESKSKSTITSTRSVGRLGAGGLGDFGGELGALVDAVEEVWGHEYGDDAVAHCVFMFETVLLAPGTIETAQAVAFRSGERTAIGALGEGDE